MPGIRLGDPGEPYRAGRHRPIPWRRRWFGSFRQWRDRGQSGFAIRYNVFSKQDALPGPQARPNVLLGHFPLAGAGSEDRYLVYGNFFQHNPSEALLQAEGRVVLYDNVFVNGGGDAIHIQPHNDVPRDMAIFSNTVLASGTGIRVRHAVGTPYRQRVLANVIAASIPLQAGEAAYNVALAYRPDLLNVAVSDLTPDLLRRPPAFQ
ncbi:hypothetical protein [Thiobacillus sp.]|uniref:hypothetical protein n=1 Tax=Thiobacillus sp. TaxID=924 RepID=UPI0025D7195A|nr:hypothetical protein [Thiobacillus sp.]